MAKGQGSEAPAVELLPAHPPKMGRGSTSTVTPEVCDAWIQALNNHEDFPEGVTEPTVFKSRGAAQSKAQKMKARLTSYADLGENTKIATRIYEDGEKGSDKWKFSLALKQVEPDSDGAEEPQEATQEAPAD